MKLLPLVVGLLFFTLQTPSLLHAEKPHVVMLIAEGEYQTEKTLPEFAKEHRDDFRTTMVFAEPDDGNRFVGIEAVGDADVLLISVRRRTLPPEQLDWVRRFVAAGKPVIGIRTANHAFCLRNKEAPEGRAVWPDWDKDVFGGHYTNHYGNTLKATVTIDHDESAIAPLLRGIDSKPFVAGGSLYKVAPLADGAHVCMRGSVEGNPAEPIAWTFKRKDGGKSFYTSLGHVDDFRGDILPKLLVNVIKWSTHK